MIKGAALSLGLAMAWGHSLRATYGVGPAIALAAFSPLLPWRPPPALHGFCRPGTACVLVKTQPLGKEEFCKEESLACAPQAGQESCPGFGWYHATSSPSIATDCFFPLVFGPLTPKAPFTLGLELELIPRAFLQQRGG